MDFFDFDFTSANDSAAPPPLNDNEFDTHDFNLCYPPPFPFINDQDTFQMKREDDQQFDNPNYMVIPEYFCSEQLNNEMDGYLPQPQDFFTIQQHENQQASRVTIPKIQPKHPKLNYVCQVGPISVEARKEKIFRYMQKKRRRNYAKKIGYDCRKRVADTRVRVKGRFVSKKEAAKLLKIQCPNLSS